MAYDYKSQIKKYEKILRTSPTAYAAGVAPTTKDIETQIQMMRVKGQRETARAEELRQAWYPEGRKEAPRKESAIQKALHTLGAPMYGIVGGIESVLGKGTEKGLWSNVLANIEEEGTVGDLLRNYGLSNAVAMPLGFALDIALDPIMWGTAGTAAFIPRVGYGIAKGMAKGAPIRGLTTALKSGALMKAETVGRLIPGLTRRAFPKGEAGQLLAPKGPVSTFYKKLSQEAVLAREGYESLVGTGVKEMLQKSVVKKRIPDQIENFLNKTPWGRKQLEMFEYSPENWYRQAVAVDDIARGVIQEEAALVKGGGINIERLKGKDGLDELLNIAEEGKRTIGKDLRESVDMMKNPKRSLLPDSEVQYYAMKGTAENIKETQKNLLKELDYIKETLLSGDTTRLSKIGALTTDELGKYLGAFETLKIGRVGYDKKVAKILTNPKARKTINVYNTFIGMFKTAKIGGNLPVSGTNAIGGNLAMTAMHGVNILDSGFHRSLGQAMKIMRGKDFSALKTFLDSPEDVIDLINRSAQLKDGGAFRSIFGIHPGLIANGASHVGIVAKQNPLVKGWDEILKVADDTLTDMYKQGTYKAAASFNQSITQQALRGEETSFLVGETIRGGYRDFLNSIKKIADGDGAAALAAKIYYNTATLSMEAYSKIDQTYKLALFLHLTNNGVGLSELTKITRRIPLGVDDVVQKAGRNIWRFKADAAMRYSSEVYMNYLAMPQAVNIMRTWPILGAPFAAFSYGMTTMMAKTALYNPAFYNQVQFLLKEISGRKSPLEKQALESPYYEWFGKEGMLKIPFFQDNPVYLNLANILPHLTMNFFQPSERTYESRFGGKVANILDKLPIIKTPEGQVLFDYIILPQIIQDEQPVGMFGQPLWTEDAGFGEKFARGAMALGESIMPPALGYAGLLTPAKEATQWIPHYRWRQLAYAKAGKTAVGIPTKEPGAQKALRVSLALAGWPTYQMKLGYAK